MSKTRNTRAETLSDFSQDRRVILLTVFSVGISFLSTIGAYCLLKLITLTTQIFFFGKFSLENVSLSGMHWGPSIIVVPIIGGLIVGLMARYGSERIRGHGIPEALEAILIGQSKMEPKVAVLKPLSSAVSIGSGGPFGAEGPIVVTGGAIGSLVAQFFHFSSIERRTLLVAGAAAGMTAIFGTPLAATLLSVELLLFEWRPRSMVPVAVSAVCASSFRVFFIGSGTLFPVHLHESLPTQYLLFAAGIGFVSAACSGLLTRLVYFSEDLFHRLPIHWMWWPALGGLAVGVGGYFNPDVLGVGYDLIHQLLLGQYSSPVQLLFAKGLVWALALGSGTSGGSSRAASHARRLRRNGVR